MKPRCLLLILIPVLIASAAEAQESLKYQLPPDEIVKIVDAPQTPLVSISPDKQKMLLMETPPIVTIGELAEEELRIAGIRIDPSVNGRSRQTGFRSFRIMNIDGTGSAVLKGLPAECRLGFPEWSYDGKKIAFTNRTASTIELWVCDLATLNAAKISDGLNQVFSNNIAWLPDNKSLIYLVIDPGRGAKPLRSPVPGGPVVQENLGKKGQSQTFQDLLRDPVDEMLFEYYAKAQLMIWNGSASSKIGSSGMITSASLSPDGTWLITEQLKRPFSYLVPYFSFPAVTQIWDIRGNVVKTLLDRPLIEDRPRGYDMVLPGPRGFSWRSDKPAEVFWVEALDGGDYSKEMQFHDQVYALGAPFTGDARKLISLEMRFNGITWGNNDYAIVYQGLSKSRITNVSSFVPSDQLKGKRKLFEYKSDDSYNNPGRFMTEPNSWGRDVLLLTERGRGLILYGSGSSPEGNRPFIDRYDIGSGNTTRLWRSEAPYYETVASLLDIQKGEIMTSRQSVTEVPNYYIRNLKTGKLEKVTDFQNPYPQLAGVHKELVKYKRSDGIDLSFTLYLPAGYSREKNGPLPTLLWAYPREFNDPSSAGQVSGSPFTFIRVSPASVLVYVTQGYAVLMDASFPIVGTEGKEPNDIFVEQLIDNARAAVDKAVEMGVTDPQRVAVSGHSYGAFMTANLLAHTRIFAAGIAESGAYNRTLTPFSFQNERRSYWEAPEIYNRMSPFMYADKVKDPLLLIHGMADNNSGTFPIQSERFYAALKGHGAVTRLVMLPLESHGYSARESILHKHWEVLNWMDAYVKNKK